MGAPFMWIVKKMYDYWWKKYRLEKTDRATKTSLFDRNWATSLEPRRRSRPLCLVLWALWDSSKFYPTRISAYKGMISLEGGQFSSILLSQCIWSLAWEKEWPLVGVACNRLEGAFVENNSHIWLKEGYSETCPLRSPQLSSHLY